MSTQFQYSMSVKTVEPKEITTTLNVTPIGDFAEFKVEPRGTTAATLRNQPRLVIHKVSKHCLANYVPGLWEATTVVHISETDLNGRELDTEERLQAMWRASAQFGVPVWTGSSIKNWTFYFIKLEMFNRLALEWDVTKDVRKFAAYVGLLFSQMDEEAAPKLFTIPTIVEPHDGEDGNCVIGADRWIGKTCQIRGLKLNPVTQMPNGYAKGIFVPIQDAGQPKLNTTQVKFGGGGDWLVLSNKYVGAAESERTGKPIEMYLSCEPIYLLKDVPEVRQMLAGRVQRDVADYLSLLTPERRVDLLKRLKGLTILNDGHLDGAKQALIDALRSPMPWCKELEARATRFAIREICESIIPSGAIKAKAAALVISNEHGEAPCDWADAKCFAVRIPATGVIALVPLRKNPYKRHIGMVVTAEVAQRVSGDADSDLLLVVDERESVELFRLYHNDALVGGIKEDKQRANGPITPRAMIDLAMEQLDQNWQVGGLTVASWKMIQAGMFEVASELLQLANLQPMTLKWNLTFKDKDGVVRPFAEHVNKVYGELRETLKGITLQWRERMKDSKGWDTPRELAKARIERPLGPIDACWNAAVSAAEYWDKTNPLKPLSLSAVASIAFGERGMVISGSAFREKSKIVKEWGKYWAHVREMKTLDDNHSAIYERVREWGKTASREAIAALLVWHPKSGDSDGFAIKWHAVFANGRGCEVLGYHPDVQQHILLKSTAAQTEALVEAFIGEYMTDESAPAPMTQPEDLDFDWRLEEEAKEAENYRN